LFDQGVGDAELLSVDGVFVGKLRSVVGVNVGVAVDVGVDVRVGVAVGVLVGPTVWVKKASRSSIALASIVMAFIVPAGSATGPGIWVSTTKIVSSMNKINAPIAARVRRLLDIIRLLYPLCLHSRAENKNTNLYRFYADAEF
jgi:hypothetical protein